MSPLFSPKAKIWSFSFAEEDSLYRDHDGNRVLADIEGGGEFVIDSRIDLAVMVDEVPQNLFRGRYQRSLLVTAAGPGRCRVDASEPSTDLPDGPVETGTRFDGCGYILGATDITDIDGENGGRVGLVFPTPFFFGVSGRKLRVTRTGEHFELVCGFELSDFEALADVGWRVQNSSKLFGLNSSFPDGTPFLGTVISHLNAASWIVQVPDHCRGLVLRKRYDAFHGRQRARVLVDGVPVGWWYEPWQNRRHRWRWARFGIPAEFIFGKESVTVTIDPPAGSPLWSVSRIEVWALRAGR